MKVGYVTCNYKAGSSWRKNLPIEINMDEEVACIVYNTLIGKAKDAMGANNYDDVMDILRSAQDVKEAIEELHDELKHANDSE